MAAEVPSAQHFHPGCPTQTRVAALTGQDSPPKEASEPSSHPHPSLTANPQSFLRALRSSPSPIHHQPAHSHLRPFLSPPRTGLTPTLGTRGVPHSCPQEPQPLLFTSPFHLTPRKAPQPPIQASSLLAHTPLGSNPAPLPETHTRPLTTCQPLTLSPHNPYSHQTRSRYGPGPHPLTRSPRSLPAQTYLSLTEPGP